MRCAPFYRAVDRFLQPGEKKGTQGNPVRLRLYKNATKWSKKIFLKLAAFWARQHHRQKRAATGPVDFSSPVAA
jgi:hypothetical protein